MDNIEAYSYLFSDSLFSNLIINFYGELVVDVMLIFGNYNNILILLLASLGSFIASLVNFCLGKIARSIKKTEQAIQSSHYYSSANKYIKFFSPMLLLLSSLPTIGPIFMVSLGLFKAKLNFVSIAILAAGKIIYYAYKIYSIEG